MLTQYADYSLLIISPDHAPTGAVNDCIDQLREGHAKLLGCVLNNIYTIPLFIQQVTGVNITGFLKRSHGRYESYGKSYGYGLKEGYGQDTSGRRKNIKKKNSTYRETSSGKGFFNESISRDSDQKEE